ncbi:apoptosis inhibitor 5 isoform X1 [Tribolium castaneum]|uniref:apoptosis inhibitor 5 isoform X1 n=1 Tax=Tribolium castaneum TaxID=7070 RepID=UPI00017580CE|nr:PREDICTED: apoptosis inhibitor 5 isoform X1 [Tribolium castaneum]|eukprot:XP_974012.2 PREDICTED: apoptosis inhibitor 5 isoform X1 [Tribolium castaneum]
MSDNLEKLYEKYNILSDAKDKVSQHSSEYVESFEGIKGTESEKMLAAQILSKFFKHFPSLQDKALNALLDLCEDEESKIRACAMRYLVSICKDVKEHLTKVTDILAQMMQLEEQRDFTTASWCLLQLWKQDSANVLRTMYNHIRSLSSAAARVKCLQFIHLKFIKPIESQPTEIENIVVEESKKLLQLQDDISSEEIVLIISCLKNSKYAKTAAGQQELLDFISEIMELDRDFDPLEDCIVDRVIICTTHALPFFSAKNESTKFVAYYCDQILPQWDKIATLEQGELFQLHLLRHLAELSIYCGKFENPSLHVVQIFDKIKLYMPTPPENADVYKMPNLEFSFVECLLFAFHRLARQCPDFLTHDPQILKDFRARLVYFSRGVQGCNKVLNSKPITGLDSVNASKAKIAPSLLNNINVLIKDLFYQPPMYKCNVTLSFKQEVVEKELRKPATSGQKRHVPITFDNGSTGTKQTRPARSGDNVKLYTPPSGKFSNNFQYDRGGSRGNRSRGRGSRGRGRNWRN